MTLAHYLETFTTNQPAEQVLRRRAQVGYSELAIAMGGSAFLFLMGHPTGVALMVPGLMGGYLAAISDRVIRQWKTGGPEFTTPLQNEMPTLLFGRRGDEDRMADADVHLDL
jgi:hypothetical protein